MNPWKIATATAVAALIVSESVNIYNYKIDACNMKKFVKLKEMNLYLLDKMIKDGNRMTEFDRIALYDILQK